VAATSQAAPLATVDDYFAGRKYRGLWSQAWQRLIRNRLAVAAGVLLGLLVLMAILTATTPAVARYGWNERPDRLTVENTHAGPSSEHWLGTDAVGRDMWSRVWEGTRISLRIGLGSQIIVLAIGMSVGAAAALGGRFSDAILMRFTDLTYAFPDLLAIILLRAVMTERDWPIIGTGDPQLPGFPGPLVQVIFAISFVSWVLTARLVRGQMLALRESDYVTAAKALGASGPRVVLNHMLPNTLGPVIVVATIGIPVAIFAEAVLGFIGFGLPPPTASLGTLVNQGFDFFRVNRWEILTPAIAIALLMLAFTFLGDGLRDALDPRTRQ
jgi:oligopeptide transport system permease protein